MVVVSGATCRSCDGCYNKSEKESNGKPLYINDRAKKVTIEYDDEDDYWYIKIGNEYMYESMYLVDELQGKYDSLFDDSIATVNCTSVCPV